MTSVYKIHIINMMQVSIHSAFQTFQQILLKIHCTGHTLQAVVSLCIY